MNSHDMEKRISLLDWGIIFSCILMLLIIYIPNYIWIEEEQYRNESRKRMNIIANAQEFYKEITGHYTLDGIELFNLVEASMDSLIADSLFIGEQNIQINNQTYDVVMSKGYDVRVDTTFSIGVPMKKNILDTIYTVGMINDETGIIDTIFINSSDINKTKDDTLFQTIFKFDTTSYLYAYTDYLSKKYSLDTLLLYCPLMVGPQKYIFDINNDDPEDIIFSVKSPVPDDYKEPRYLFFSFEAGRHGSITGGRKSWSNN